MVVIDKIREFIGFVIHPPKYTLQNVWEEHDYAWVLQQAKKHRMYRTIKESIISFFMIACGLVVFWIFWNIKDNGIFFKFIGGFPLIVIGFLVKCKMQDAKYSEEDYISDYYNDINVYHEMLEDAAYIENGTYIAFSNGSIVRVADLHVGQDQNRYDYDDTIDQG